jgi:hypothetical protein
MQQRAGMLFLSKQTKRILLILEDQKWTVPTFARSGSLLEDSNHLLKSYSDGRILPIELYISEDKGFEYGTYICLVDKEFTTEASSTISWASLENLPKNLHAGLKTTLNNIVIRTKIDTILVIQNDD